MKTVLIVEDVELNIDLLLQLLEDDYHLLVAKDGEEGVAMTLDLFWFPFLSTQSIATSAGPSISADPTRTYPPSRVGQPA